MARTKHTQRRPSESITGLGSGMNRDLRPRKKTFSVTDFAIGLFYDVDYKKGASGKVYTQRQVECTLSASTEVHFKMRKGS